MIQAIADNPFTSYRQLLQQYTYKWKLYKSIFNKSKSKKNFLKIQSMLLFRFKSKINWKFYKTLYQNLV